MIFLKKQNVMQCSKHKTYKGLKKTKRNCPNCIKLYKTVQHQIRNNFDPKRPFKSITTFGKRFGSTMMLAELSCVMLYGIQPEYFWQRDTKIAQHFKLVLKKIMAWKRRDPNFFKNIDIILFHIYTQYFKEQIAQQTSSNLIPTDQVVKEEQEDVEQISLDSDYFGVDTEKARKEKLGIGSLRKKTHGKKIK
jgi:hypothetical protein